MKSIDKTPRVTRRLPPRVAGLLFAAVCLVSVVSAEEITQIFRGKTYDPNYFRPTGPNAAAIIRPDSRGLRITLPTDHGIKPPVGLVLRSGIKGDFQATMEFEILQVEKPTGGTGAGISLWITIVSYTKEAATIGWLLKPGGEKVFFSHRATTPIGGQREHHGGEPRFTSETTGKVRLVRAGTRLTYLVAAGQSEVFEEIFDSEIGTDDLNTLRFAADNGGSSTLVDVRIREINVVA